jgi:hypothetical protein
LAYLSENNQVTYYLNHMREENNNGLPIIFISY